MKNYLYLIFLISLFAFGCQKYAAKPIDRQKMVEEADAHRKVVLSPEQPFTFNSLLEVVSLNNPDLQLLKLQYQQQEKYAKTKTPLANPNLGIGVSKGFNIEGATKSVTQPFISLGFTVPLWGKRKLVRELEFLEVSATQQEQVILHRNIYLELRQLYLSLRLKDQQKNLLKTIVGFLESEIKASEQQLLLGHLSLLDSGLLKAEFEQLFSEKQSVEQEIILLYSRLSSLSGLSAETLHGLVLPKYEPETVVLPPREIALQILIENSPALNRLHAKYDIAEKSLQLEVRKQYPDLQIETGFENEPGQSAKYLGLGLGMELPIFDRNQKAILAAHQKREQILLEYQLQARHGILEMETAIEMIKSVELQIKWLQSNQMKTAQNNYELAKREFQFNKIEKFELIETRKAFYEVHKVYIKSLESYHQYWITLESALGAILFDQGSLPNATNPILSKTTTEANKSKENEDVKK
jgi:cobalt-zinc-cadmium efflux system outer membrane protein